MTQLALRREDAHQSLLAVLKALEIEKTLGSEPVLTALRHYPAEPNARPVLDCGCWLDECLRRCDKVVAACLAGVGARGASR